MLSRIVVFAGSAAAGRVAAGYVVATNKSIYNTNPKLLRLLKAELANGGPVDSNGVLFHDDRVLIIPKEEFLTQKKTVVEDVHMKDEGEANDILSDRIKVKSSNSRHDPVCYKNLSELKLKNLQSLFKNHKTEPTQDDDESE